MVLLLELNRKDCLVLRGTTLQINGEDPLDAQRSVFSEIINVDKVIFYATAFFLCNFEMDYLDQKSTSQFDNLRKVVPFTLFPKKWISCALVREATSLYHIACGM